MSERSLLDAVVALATQAGNAIVEIYQRDDLGIQRKADNSPITEADLAAHHIIEAGLKQLTPDIPVYSEESGDIPYATRKDWPRYWLVDPLDGTKEFVKRNGEFTVNIALIENNQPVLGVVQVPVTGACYFGAKKLGAFVSRNGKTESIQVRKVGNPVVMVASRSHGADKLDVIENTIRENIGEVQLTNMGSSLKLCLIAEGKADIYPRLAPTSEWDTAAADAIVRAAGGAVLQTSFEPLQYNKPDILNPHFLVLGETPSFQFLRAIIV